MDYLSLGERVTVGLPLIFKWLITYEPELVRSPEFIDDVLRAISLARVDSADGRNQLQRIHDADPELSQERLIEIAKTYQNQKLADRIAQASKYEISDPFALVQLWAPEILPLFEATTHAQVQAFFENLNSSPTIEGNFDRPSLGSCQKLLSGKPKT